MRQKPSSNPSSQSSTRLSVQYNLEHPPLHGEAGKEATPWAASFRTGSGSLFKRVVFLMILVSVAAFLLALLVNLLGPLMAYFTDLAAQRQ